MRVIEWLRACWQRPVFGGKMEQIPLVDLFCGMGGLSLGFARAGFQVTGYDIHPRVPEIFGLNGIGRAVVADLRTTRVADECRRCCWRPRHRPGVS